MRAGTPAGGVAEQVAQLSAIPEVLRVTRRQPGAGPGRSGIEYLARCAVPEEGMDLPEPARPRHRGVGHVILERAPDPLHRIVVRAVPGAVQQLQPRVLL